MRLDIREGHPEIPEHLARFQRVVRVAFGQRRKTLLNAFRAANISDECLHRAQQDTGISLTRRAETLSVEEFEHLSKALPSF